MKISTRIHRTLVVLMLVIVCALSMRRPVQAATTVSTPTGFTVTPNERTAVLKWKPVAGATGYKLYMRDPSGTVKGVKNLRSGSAVTYKKTWLDVCTTYTFFMYAYKTLPNGKTVYSKRSAEVSCTTKVVVPARPTGKMYASGDGKVTLSWNSVRYATGYKVYQRNSSGKYVQVAKLTGTKVTIKNLTNNHAYYFRVLPYRQTQGHVAKGPWSYAIKAMPKGMTKTLKDANVQSMNYSAIVTTNVNATRTDGKGTIYVSAGTAVTIKNLDSGNCTVALNSTTTVYINRNYLSLKSQLWNSSKRYSNAAAEEYVNYKGYSSPTKYLVWVNLYTQRIYLFTGSQYAWKLSSTQLCATGLMGSRTRVGVNPLGKYPYPTYPFADNTFGYWLSWVNSGNAIHSWLYWRGSGALIPPEVYGKPVSHGCVRTNINYAKYIYDKVPGGTTAIVY